MAEHKYAAHVEYGAEEAQAGDDTQYSEYFKTNPAPASLAQHTQQAQDFIKQHVAHNRRVVLVTSGGTTVPLETQTVRFIDNFSAGTRGATSAEYFLREGYAVIFLHRQFSLLPFSRHYSHSTNCFLDFMEEDDAPPSGSPKHDTSNPDHGTIVVRTEYQPHMRKVLREYKNVKENNLLLLLPFVTVTDYLHELRALAQVMRPLGTNAMFYLAAAVSDFFIPRNRMAEHKIQSSNEPAPQKSPSPSSSSSSSSSSPSKIPSDKIYTGYNDPQPPKHGKKLVIDLDPVPKFLSVLVKGWAPEGSMIVSFKLETDPNLLISKAEQAIARYQHHLVIGNMLSTRKWEVIFVERDEEGEMKHRWIRIPKEKGQSGEVEIESQIIPELKAAHLRRIDRLREAQEKGE
ncbi:hypothetical protein KEM55_003403 [Ascosphaera atra]|nr:hypothetical protein KEM55_003403 [Ascosphaera atra]